ncbi:4-phosphoerythronate dehydrogenase [Candidatus Curculioniphilus buchneri]|uniref:4-phosphoerythronate dehydrogenase n=1 Tax=Candidatus Curculioniphilus buchneri TaxID=690594 RepID=UPI00376ED43F
MKILVDESILYAKRLFSYLGCVETITSKAISTSSIMLADALIVNSVTRVDNALLNGSRIQFVGTVTSGTDHIDIDWLVEEGIEFSAAEGCNAIAVVEYVFSALLWLAQRDNFSLSEKTIGIVGVGNIGSCLHHRLSAFGVRTLLCDPLLAEKGEPGNWYSLETLINQVDVLSLHTPLTRTGRYATWHLIDEQILAALPDHCILINTCRGEVIDNTALFRILEKGKSFRVILDVWELIPSLPFLLSYIDIGTAHIAGYTLEGKARGTAQIFNAYSKFLGNTMRINSKSLLPFPLLERIRMHGKLNEEVLRLLVHSIYNICHDDIRLRRFSGLSSEFDYLRKNYYHRREWSSLFVETSDRTSADKLMQLGFSSRLYTL